MSSRSWLLTTYGLVAPWANGDHRNPMLLVNLHLFVEGDDHGMSVSAEHRVHYPTLEIASLYARDGPVIINSK